MVNDERPVRVLVPVEDVVGVTITVDRVVVHVDEDDPESSVPVLLPDPELAGGHSVVSESEDAVPVSESDEPVPVGVIVRVCTPGEPLPLVVQDVEELEPESEPAEEEPDLVTVRRLATGALEVADEPGTV